jgi:hypothetical protein
VKVVCVGPEHWPAVRDMLMPAIDLAGEYDEAEVVRQIETTEAQLWLVGDGQAAVVTSISTRATGKVCLIWLLGGRDPKAWIDGIETIESAAREAGCVGMEIVGRAGWTRLLPEYRQIAVVIRKALQ